MRSRTGLRTIKPLTAAAAARVREVIRSPGSPLTPETRTRLEGRFGHDFSRVRVHTDAQAAASARSVGAAAYTVGRHIVFGAGHHRPGTPAGDRVLAHELTHVVQQQGAPERPETRSGDADSLEREARQAAQAVVQGSRVQVAGRAGPGIQRLPWDSDALDISLEPLDPKTPPQVYYIENGFLHQRLSSNLPVYQGPFCQNVTLPFKVGLEFRVDWSGDPRPQPFTPPQLKVVFHFDAARGGFKVEHSDNNPRYTGDGKALQTSFGSNFAMLLAENGPFRMTFTLKDPDTGINRVYDDVIQIEAKRPCA